MQWPTIMEIKLDKSNLWEPIPCTEDILQASQNGKEAQLNPSNNSNNNNNNFKILDKLHSSSLVLP